MTKRIAIIIIIILIILGVGLWLLTKHNNPSNQQTTKPPQKNTIACINSLLDDVKIGQKIMVAVYSNQLASETPELAKMNVGGVIVMDAISQAQLNDFRTSMPIAPLIAVDQEGGTVQRYTAEGRLPGAEDMANNFSDTQAYQKYLADYKYLKSIGITTNFSPVVDVISRSPNPLPGRLYSADPNIVTAYASAAIKATQDAGINPVIKHFPGLGSADGNTDYGSATTDPLSTLETRDLLPYKQLASQNPDVMVANAIVPDLTGGQPAIWSSQAIKLLRGIGYQHAVVYSDSLTAKAIPGTLAEAVVKAWQAGIDVALIVQKPAETAQIDAYLQDIMTDASQALKSGALNSDDFSASIQRIFDRKGVDACQLENNSI